MKSITYFSFKKLLAVRLLMVLFIAGLTYNLSYSGTGQQENIVVTGKVTDVNTDEPLPGVTVLSKGTSTGTITDVDGNYSITVAPDDVLQFSYIGYLTEEMPVNNATTINVAMVVDVIGLDEVIVTGYGVQKKSDVTGSISSISSEQLAEIPVSGVDHALQGRAAGVNVINNSGRPGEAATIQIRGITSVNSAEPLVIIDGVRGDISEINPGDIASVEVLKDASSASIYGVSGGNGVVLITTKQGISGENKVSFNFYTGLETPTNKLDLMNSQDWAKWVEEKYYNEGNDSYADTVRFTNPDALPTYDWQSEVFQPAWTQNYDLSFRGGSEKNKYMISSSYFDQEGMVRNSEYSRITFRINSEHKLTKRLTYDQKISFFNTRTFGFRPNVWTEYYDGPFRKVFQMSPPTPFYFPNGQWGYIRENASWGYDRTDNTPILNNEDNPLAQLDMIDRLAKQNNFAANMGVTVNILEGLSFTSRFAGYLNFGDTKEFQDVYYNTTTDHRDMNKLLMSMNRYMGYNTQQLLNYNFSIADAHNFSILLGMEARRDWNYDIRGERDSLSSAIPAAQYFIMSDNNASASQIIQGGAGESRRLGYFGRITYDYKGKYLLSSNIRRDGVSNLDKAKRFGYFPSVSVGWKFSEEAFMQNQSFISFGKIRYGYGEAGNFPRNETSYPYLSIVRKPTFFGYSFENSTVSSVGAAPVQIENPGLGWETVKMSNFGIDLSFFQNSLSLSAEYYKKVNEDMIMLNSVPYIAGSFSYGSDIDQDNTNPLVNIGSIQNTGFEFTLGYKITKGDLKGSFDLNFSTLKNKVLKLATDSLKRGGAHNVNPITMTCEGRSISEFWGYETDGLFRSEEEVAEFVNAEGEMYLPWAVPGDFKFIDVNDDGQVLTDDDKVFLGSPLPKFVFGFSINLEYKGFDFSAFFNGTYGNKIFNGTKTYLYYYQGFNNHLTGFSDRYIAEDIYKYNPATGQEELVVAQNTDTDIPRDASSNYTKPLSFYIEDGSYLRLRNVILGYTIPQKITSIVNIDKLRLYVGGRNLFTLTKYTGLNPEAIYTTMTAQDAEDRQNLDMGIDVGAYPLSRMFLFGVNLTF